MKMERVKLIGVALALPLLVLWASAYLLVFFVWGGVLRFWFWRAHAARGRPILFVYSESPKWQAYIEENILPRIGNCAVVLNWSQRRTWDSASPWEARFFRRFAGDREFNPLALVFWGPGRIRAIRFHQAFLDFKHGKELALREAEAELFSRAEAAG
jgi:hypothetical protein